MTETTRCPKCGNPLPDMTPLAGCPTCMLAEGLESPVKAIAQTSPIGSRWTAPSIEELNDVFPQLTVSGLLGQGGMGAVYHAKQDLLIETLRSRSYRQRSVETRPLKNALLVKRVRWRNCRTLTLSLYMSSANRTICSSLRWNSSTASRCARRLPTTR